MELLFIALIGIGIGFIVRYALPGRETHGMLLLGALSGIASLIVWPALLWLGFTFDGGWIWVYSMLASTIVAVVGGIVLPRSRRESDRALLTKLSGGLA